MKRTILVTIVLCTVFFILASSCLAQVIKGCVKNNGDLSIVSGSGQCKPNETPISWNVIGPEGPQGPQGPAGITNGIGAAVWGEFIIDQVPASGGTWTNTCSVPFFAGADSIDVTPPAGGFVDGGCQFTISLPAGQPQSWGTAYACFASVVSGNGTPWGSTCQSSGSMDATLKPAPIFQCLDASGAPHYAQIQFLCIAP